MPASRLELMKGTLDLMILQTLALRPLHGAAVAERLEQISRGAFQVKAGSLFPALHRLEQEGWIAGTWTESPGKRRVRVYQLTAAGSKQLSAEKAHWLRVVSAMGLVLEQT